MSDFNTVNNTDLDTEDDWFLLRQGTSDYKTTREVLAASISNARWTEDANYLVGSEITGSDGERYVALINNGASSTVVDPTTNKVYWKKISSKVLSLLAGLRLRESAHGYDRTQVALKANGATYNRLDYPTLWNIAKTQAVSQTLINNSPTVYAANYGTGNGTTTFTVPNYTLMPYDATSGVYGSNGTTAEQQNLAHTHTHVMDSAGEHSHTFPISYDRAGSATARAGEGTNRTGNTSLGGLHNHPLTINSSGGSVLRPKTNFSDVWIIHGEVF